MHCLSLMCSLFFFNDTATTEIYTLSLHDALPIYNARLIVDELRLVTGNSRCISLPRSEEHTSELQSHSDLVCRLLLEKNTIQDGLDVIHRHHRSLFHSLLDAVRL